MGVLQARGHIVGAMAACAALGCAGPALAQESGDVAVLDKLSEDSQDAKSAIGLAHEQAAAGQLQQAAATLERVLIFDENADDARLVYAAMLCRLDDRQSAKLELETERTRRASAAAWKEAEDACGAELAKGPSKTRIGGQVSIGFSYDQDALGALRLQAAGVAASADGAAFVADARLSGRFGGDEDHFYADMDAQTLNHVSGPNSDYQFGQVALGYGKVLGGSELTVGGVVRYGRQFGDPFVTEYGGQAGIAFPAGSNRRVAIRAEAVWQDYAIGFGLSDGVHYDLGVSYEGRSAANVAWAVGAGAEYKDARLKTERYVAAWLTGAVQLPLDARGSYARLSTILRYIDFAEEYGQSREDLRLHSQLAFGTPILAQGLYGEVAGFYSYRTSNQASFLADYSSLGGAVRLIWQFGDGRQPR